MSRQYGSHVQEWASLLGERVADDAVRTDRCDGRADGVERQTGR